MSTTKQEKEKESRLKAMLQSVHAWLHGAGMRCLLLMLAGCVVLFALCCTVCVSSRYSLQVGEISDRNIAATMEVEDRLATQTQRDRAAQAVGPSYHLDETVNEQVLTMLGDIFSELSAVQAYGKTLRESKGLPATASATFTVEEVENAQLLSTNISLSYYQANLLMRTDGATFQAMCTAVTMAVEAELQQTIHEGQESAAIDRIISACSSQMSNDLLNSLIRQVLTASVKANMLVDHDATDAARQNARAAVNPVIYKQGQFIIREGERVTENQLEMLGALGLLTSSEFKIAVYGGALLLIACAMAVLWMLLQLMAPEALRNVRTLVVILLVMVICEGLSAFCISVINVYLSPVCLCAILLTGLLGARIGTAAGLSMTLVIASLSAASSITFSNETISLMLASLAGNVVAVHFLAGKPQRVSAVICGALVGMTNFVIMLAIGLMTSVEIDNALYDAAWCMAGGLLSGLIAVGFQPVFEAAFNLATPSKLMELANPNHPLLRRLLMEAPGTYHHSIIVANLAEAAAERIGANMLLARTGAYFHDVGKLKRPMYFKENQHGDNPHDRTTAHLSAAIVTAHTTDGLRLAQKHRLPLEIQKIILEHHGDTPVMYFYHKALQQADGKPVDVKDFRYNGDRPTTKESAIVMLADTIEAAVRSMSDPTPQAIAQFIERLVRGKIEDGQLSHSPLSLHDIDGISDAFIKVLRGVFHERIEYPTVHMEPRGASEVSEEAAEPAADDADAMAAPYKPPMPDNLVPAADAAKSPEAAPGSTAGKTQGEAAEQ